LIIVIERFSSSSPEHFLAVPGQRLFIGRKLIFHGAQYLAASWLLKPRSGDAV